MNPKPPPLEAAQALKVVRGSLGHRKKAAPVVVHAVAVPQAAVLSELVVEPHRLGACISPGDALTPSGNLERAETLRSYPNPCAKAGFKTLQLLNVHWCAARRLVTVFRHQCFPRLTVAALLANQTQVTPRRVEVEVVKGGHVTGTGRVAAVTETVAGRRQPKVKVKAKAKAKVKAKGRWCRPSRQSRLFPLTSTNGT